MPRTRASVPSSESPSQWTTSRPLATQSQARLSLVARYAMQMPIAEATADAEGRPQCSYKGGDPGFVRVLDETTLAFPNYDGNGMYLSMGNVLVNEHVGLLFIDFAGDPPRRLRVNGTASVAEDDPLLD